MGIAHGKLRVAGNLKHITSAVGEWEETSLSCMRLATEQMLMMATSERLASGLALAPAASESLGGQVHVLVELEEVARMYVKSVRQFADVDQGHVTPSVLYVADIGSVHVSLKSQSLLGQALALAESPQPPTELLFWVLYHPGTPLPIEYLTACAIQSGRRL